MRVLIVEDEKKVARAIHDGLVAERYQVTLAHTGEEGFYLLNAEVFDLVLLDLSLPGRDGLDILATLRERNLETPVLILTARDSVQDRVLGLETGADDYLVKPFAFTELLARIRALLRRGRTDQVTKLRHADLEMDLITHRVTRSGTALDLTATEFQLLEFLLRQRGRTVSRAMIAREVWNERDRMVPLDNIIDVHIARLRKKVDAPFDSRLINTVRGVGFLLSASEPHP